MQQILLQEINKIKKSRYVDKKIFDIFQKRIQSDPKLIKKVNIKSHFCSFFVPINSKSKSIFLVHHIKAQDWIPPGGHIEENEHPIDTVKREFEEELGHQLSNETIELFSLTATDVSNNPRNPCQMHYDIWYLVNCNKNNFVYDKGEFYSASWFSFEKGLNKIKTPHYNKTVGLIYEYLTDKQKTV